MKNRVPFTGRARGGRRPAHSAAGRLPALVALAAGLLSGSAALAQSPAAPEVVPAYARAILDGSVTADPNIMQAGCASCGGGSPLPAILPFVGSGGCGDGGCMCSGGDTCNSCACKPGKAGYCPLDLSCPPDCYVGRVLHGIAACICCPDPCYVPVWVTTANSAFFMDTVRPQTYTRFGWDTNRNVRLPDRAEFLWAKAGGKGPPKVETNLDYDDLTLYQEVASGGFAAFFSTSYRGIDADQNVHHANFGDLTAGTKSLLIDCELLQLAFQFKTYIPTGNSRNGIGTGHLSLEPSLLASLKLNPKNYLQTQVAYWIPIGGDQAFQGPTWHYHLSLNHSWCKWGAWELIGTSEINGWTFTDGGVTVPVTNAMGMVTGITTRAAGETYVTTGGGFRLVFCERYDLGFGVAAAVTDDHFARETYRTEFRIRY